MYFSSYHPFADGDKTRTLVDGKFKYGEMVVTKVAYALTFKYVQKDHRMMKLYLSSFFCAYYDNRKMKETTGWVLIRGTVDVHGESGAGQSAAGFGEPPPPPKGLAGVTPKGKKGKNKVKPTWDPLNRIVDMPPPSGHVNNNMDTAKDGRPTRLAKSA